MTSVGGFDRPGDPAPALPLSPPNLELLEIHDSGLAAKPDALGLRLPDVVLDLSELIEAVRRAVRTGQNLEEALAATPLGQAYTQASAGTDSPFAAQFVAFAAGIHRWNVWRTYQGMKGEPT